MLDSLNQIQVVLVEPTHPGNIGAVARSMKTMGLSRLVLVNPKKFPHYEASKRAAGAESVLETARVEDTLARAVSDCTIIYGTSVRDREVEWPTSEPRVAAIDILAHLRRQTTAESDSAAAAAILFGRESSGLSNEELDLCQAQIRIPANSEYSSLNLASAVQIICYELRLAALQDSFDESSEQESDTPLTALERRQLSATQAQRNGHLSHLMETLTELDFVKAESPTMLMRKLTRLYNKADLSVEEIQILRGILSAVQSRLAGNDY